MSRFLFAFVLLGGALLAGCGGDDALPQDAGPTDAAPGATCTYLGTVHQDREVFPAIDGCNSCQCNPNGNRPGEVGCTLVECPPDAGR